MFKDFTSTEIDKVMSNAWNAFHAYKKFSLRARASFMRAVAAALEAAGDALIQTAMSETHLPEARLRAERGRTVLQLRQYADACEKAEWMEISIDTAIPDKNPRLNNSVGQVPKPDLRKMMVPLGPVVVFGASNFPFAYSTAGGDTATAFAAGCPVIVKAHPAHAKTSQVVADIILKVAAENNMPNGIFSHVQGAGFETGKALVMHPHTKAVGFTGSYAGGKQLFDWANQRKEPIPVFSEMGSVNPVYLLPEKLNTSASDIAMMYAASITLGVGQFCTNPGLIIGIESSALQTFIHDLGKAIQKTAPAPMLHAGIVKAYKENKGNALLQEGVHLVAESETEVKADEGLPTIATVDAQTFLNNPVLHKEVFGPYSLVIRCRNQNEMLQVAQQMEGQLTSTLMATENDIRNNEALIDAVQNTCGRLILNSVPTGVEVCLSMHHGGPFPSTTDARYTSVGADAIKRFARPICYQNWSNELLPDELKNENPLSIMRRVNNTWTNDVIK
ncbi:MAG: aldehyde dehydrogenase (NADP(+)) [Chitinophagaceae bacterium]|nr:aldehyde dehydrogenase (NADP(+)) [Chitinophagaceae bacterium]